jgi:AraC-like DNA-binding protein
LLVSSENQHIKIEEIAEMVGYNSKSAFNTAFKKIVGQTPSQYRKRKNSLCSNVRFYKIEPLPYQNNRLGAHDKASFDYQIKKASYENS